MMSVIWQCTAAVKYLPGAVDMTVTVLGASVDTTVVVYSLKIVDVTNAVDAGKVCVAYDVKTLAGRVVVSITVCGGPAAERQSTNRRHSVRSGRRTRCCRHTDQSRRRKRHSIVDRTRCFELGDCACVC